jgi:hypothetical protein
MKIISCNWIYNKADRLESSSIQIYPELQMGLYTQLGWYETALIKW